MGRLARLAALTLALVSVMAAAACSYGSASPALQAGSPAPDFTLKNLEGQAVSLSELRGRPVLLNFWASWCGPCRQEMPFIQQVSDDEKWAEQGLAVLAVNLGEPSADVRRFVADNGLTFPVLLDSEQAVARDYSIRSIPATFFIDKDGIIRDWKIGSFASPAEIDWRLIHSILEDSDA